ncbi:hypothetical protein CPT_Pollock58 [Escherichia phage Pollock]|uniref:Uncharacterized protein n=1 Tax=Escherichia phage Pollock TaxID=1540097 RepID=A0A0A0YRL9_9CAUD|nr:hypothetical protein ACQ44_gp58 [Escherichia phage Pollock]AIX12417.1 hypothetical protein CPT_Pollock58 [Escherichia phage Pollock]
MIVWIVIGLIVVICRLSIFRQNDPKVKKTMRNVKIAFEDERLYWAIITPSLIFWSIILAIFWPVVVYTRFFYKQKK